MPLFEKKKPPEEEEGKDATTELLGAIKTMGESFSTGFESMGKNIAGLGLKMDAQTKTLAPPPTAKKEEPIIPEGEDVEQYTNQQLLDSVQKIVDRGVNKLSTRVDDNLLESQKSDLNRQLIELQTKNPIFDKLRDKMTEIVKANPALANNPEDLLILARAKSPEIVTEFEEAEKKVKEESEEEGGHPKPKAFGGLLPGSTPGATDEEPTKMELKEASDKAWETAMEGVPLTVIGGADAA